MVLTTERLLLRPILPSDAADMFEYSCHPEVGPNAGWKPHETLEETHAILKEIFLDQEDIFGIQLQTSGKLVGSIGLLTDPKRENPQARMLGYAIGRNYWGKGYMTEAVQAVVEYGFAVRGYQLLSAYCYPHNLRSQRVLQKCGFVYEGRLTQAELLYDGTILDNDCYSCIK